MVMKYGDLYLNCRRVLLETEDAQTAGLMARNLVAFYSGKTQEEVLRDRDLYAGEKTCEGVESATTRLLEGEPLPYVLGEWEFYGLPLHVNKNVLIPRDDTCAVVSLAISRGLFLDKDPRILDLCCGSGCIGLAIASRLKDARVTMADLSAEALAVARRNCARNHLSSRVRCVQVNAMEPAPAFLGKFDMIVSNPPYISAADMEELGPEVKDFEPTMALYGGEDGLDFYRSIAKNYTSALKKGGFLALEFDLGQGDDICAILEEHGYTILERTRDYNDRERAVLAQYGRKED